MLPRDAAHAALRRLFRDRLVVDLEQLLETLQTRTRMSVFRRLSELGHLTSYTHNGRYYTLRTIPGFDDHGLWFHQGIGFSRAGTLKQTVAGDIARADAGRTHGELEALLHVRVHNTVSDLVREGQIARQSFGGRHLYVSRDAERAAGQVANREEMAAGARCLTPDAIIEVLVEALRAGPAIAAPAVVSKRLGARGVLISAERVRDVFALYGLEPGKKTPSPSRRSRP